MHNAHITHALWHTILSPQAREGKGGGVRFETQVQFPNPSNPELKGVRVGKQVQFHPIGRKAAEIL